MNDELRAAAVELASLDLGLYQSPTVDDSLIRAGIKLARMVVAERSESPIDESWLQKLGFKWREEWAAWNSDDDNLSVTIWRSTGEPKVWMVGYEDDFRWPHDLRTRGEALLVFRALGVTLKGTEAAT